MLLCCVYLYIRPETFGTTLVDQHCSKYCDKYLSETELKVTSLLHSEKVSWKRYHYVKSKFGQLATDCYLYAFITLKTCFIKKNELHCSSDNSNKTISMCVKFAQY